MTKITWEFEPPKTTTKKEIKNIENYLIDLQESFYKIMPAEFRVEKPLKKIGQIYLTSEKTTKYAKRKSTQEPDLWIGLALPCWHLGMPHELSHYIHGEINPIMEDEEKPQYSLRGFDAVPTPIYTLGELVAEYGALRFFDLEGKLEIYRKATQVHKISPAINNLYNLNKNILPALSRMSEEEALKEYKEVFQEAVRI